MTDTVQYLTGLIQSGERRPHQIITANPIMVMTALQDPAYMDVMRGADLLVPDGTGVVWAADKAGSPYPGVQISGFRDGYFSQEQDAEVIAAIREAEPDILFVARAVDTQEPWIARYKEQLGVPVMMGVGGSFDVISGKSKRAPKLFQQLRAEWLYRLLREPTRAKRMLALPKFVVKVLRDKENLTKPR
ncbi:hypothetical protein BGX30_005787 [Mortierella sp. GBA39]|nr:hypothetical protein BGX30_005787 [Mortierella sp. GBA39]